MAETSGVNTVGVITYRNAPSPGNTMLPHLSILPEQGKLVLLPGFQVIGGESFAKVSDIPSGKSRCTVCRLRRQDFPKYVGMASLTCALFLMNRQRPWPGQKGKKVKPRANKSTNNAESSMKSKKTKQE